MQRILLNMQNFLFSEAVERALLSDGDFHVIVVEKPQDIVEKCRLLSVNALLMEVTGSSPWLLSERLKLREEVRQRQPDCKIVLLVDEHAEKQIAEQVMQVKRDRLIDQFVFASTSTSFLAALMDTL